MTVNRMGSTRRPLSRKTLLTGTLTLGALAASGGVAMASHNDDDSEHKIKPASQSQVQSSHEQDDDEGEYKSKKGRVCLRLDEKARKAIHDAEAAASGSTITVGLDQLEVVPCKSVKPPKPKPTTTATTPPAPPPTSTTPPTTPPPPPPTTTTPKPTTPTPTVTATAS